jgi:hypothetical protein
MGQGALEARPARQRKATRRINSTYGPGPTPPPLSVARVNAGDAVRRGRAVQATRTVDVCQ